MNGVIVRVRNDVMCILVEKCIDPMTVIRGIKDFSLGT